MKYLLSQLALLIFSVILLYFFSELPDFLPVDERDQLDFYKVSAVLAVLFILFESLISITIYLIQKFLAFGWKEFPDKYFSLKWGIGLSIGLILVIILHLFHLLSIFWGLVILIIISVIIIIL